MGFDKIYLSTKFDVSSFIRSRFTEGVLNLNHTYGLNGRYQLILLGEQRHTVCEQLAQSCFMKRSGQDLQVATERSHVQVRRPITSTATTLPRHTFMEGV